MKLAPNVKLLPKDKGEDAVIFAGDDAYSHAEHYMQGGEARKRGDKIPPVYLGRRDLGNLENLRIVDDGRSRAIVRRAGKLDTRQSERTAEPQTEAHRGDTVAAYDQTPAQKPQAR